jgi:hypothetical protein
MVAHEMNFIFLRPTAGGHAAILIGVHFVLRSDRLDGNAFGCVTLQKLQKVLRVNAQVVIAHGAAQHRVVEFHPARRTPRRGEEEQVGIHVARLTEDWKNIFAVVVHGKSREVGIGVAVIKAVDFRGVVARADAGAVNVEGHLGGMEHLVEQLLAGWSRELVEHVAGGVGEGAAETKNFLVPRRGVQQDLICCSGCARRWSPTGMRSGGEPLVPGRDPHGNFRTAAWG